MLISIKEKKMRILITGGAGFIGSHIQDKYIELGHDVSVMDNFSTGKREYLNPAATLLEGDITDEEFVKASFEAGNFDVVNHHAAQINVRASFEDPVNDCNVNVIGTLKILKAIIDHQVSKIIFSSTGGAIYGSPENLPVEETTPADPESPYAISKLTCENYIKNLSTLNNFDYTIFRYANIYGPRQIAKGEAGVVAIFTEKMLAGVSPVIFGSGDNTRDYVFVDDVVNANVIALEKGSGGIFNIGTSVETNVHQVFDAVSSAFGEKALECRFGDEVPEVGRIALDYRLVKGELGWEPSMGFDEGVGVTVKSFGVG